MGGGGGRGDQRLLQGLERNRKDTVMQFGNI